MSCGPTKANIEKYLKYVEDRKNGMSAVESARNAGYQGKYPDKSFDKFKSDLRVIGIIDTNGELTDYAKQILESKVVQNTPIAKPIVFQNIPLESKKVSKKDTRRRVQIDFDEEDLIILEQLAKEDNRTITNYCKTIIKNSINKQ